MTDRFRDVAERVLDAVLADNPEWAGDMGDQRFAHALRDRSRDADTRRGAMLTDALGALDEIDDTMLGPDDRVDLEILRSRISADLWRTTELRPHTWDPLEHAPGDALYGLLVKELLPLPQRLDALVARCSALPDYLATARDRLSEGSGMPRVHVETAITRLEGTCALLLEQTGALVSREPGMRARLGPARDTALQAMAEHSRWLRSQLEHACRDPRLGERDYAAQLWYTLDSELSPELLLTRAESDLIATEEALADAAQEYDRRPRHRDQAAQVLRRIAAEHAACDAAIRAGCEESLRHLTARVRELDLVSVPDHSVRIIPMPHARRGVSTAYCEPPGPLRPGPAGPTLIAVAPPPPDWSAARRASFYREYNTVALRNLMAHEAVPGHALQLAHAARHRGGTRVRRVLWSGTFAEGWAVYSEEAVAVHGWAEGAETENLALRLAQLKTRLRVILNAILDVRLHTGDITEAEAMDLMTVRGHQEEGEAAGKWRRAQLTSAQLSTYYVGYREVADLVRDLRQARPGDGPRQLHDAVLAHGSPPPRHLRDLLAV